MLIIRIEQMEALARHRREIFLDGLTAAAGRHWPEVAAALGPAGLRARVHEAVVRAEGYGIRARRDLGRYVNVSLALGAGFDADPRYPWAAALLGATTMRPAARMERLCERTAEALRAGTGG